MGFAIKISAYYDWSKTYFVQGASEIEALQKAYKMFRDTVSCYIPNTLEEAENCNDICVEILADIEQIIL